MTSSDHRLLKTRDRSKSCKKDKVILLKAENSRLSKSQIIDKFHSKEFTEQLVVRLVHLKEDSSQKFHSRLVHTEQIADDKTSRNVGILGC